MSPPGSGILARKARVRALALPVALWLGGCDLAPRYEVPAAPLPAHFKEGGNWQKAEPGDDLPRGIWWTAFKDPTLNSLEPQVDEANQTLAAAFANYQQARTQVQQAEAGLFPTLDQNSQLTTNRQSDHRTYRAIPSNEPSHYGDNRLTIQSSYEIDLWGRVHDQIQSAAALTQANAALLESVRLSLHAQLARNYLALRGYDQQLKLLTDTAKAFQDALTLTQNRLAGKIASPMDVDRAQAQLETAKALSDDVLARRAVVEHAIATLIGRPASNFSIPRLTVTIASPRGTVAAPSTLLERRPDIAAAERQVAAANEQIGVARADFYPRFFFNLSGGTQDRGVRLLDLKNELFTLGPSVSFPILDGGRRAATLEAALARPDRGALPRQRVAGGAGGGGCFGHQPLPRPGRPAAAQRHRCRAESVGPFADALPRWRHHLSGRRHRADRTAAAAGGRDRAPDAPLQFERRPFRRSGGRLGRAVACRRSCAMTGRIVTGRPPIGSRRRQSPRSTGDRMQDHTAS